MVCSLGEKRSKGSFLGGGQGGNMIERTNMFESQ